MQLQIRFVKARVGRSTGLRCNVNSETMSFKFFKKKNTAFNNILTVHSSGFYLGFHINMYILVSSKEHTYISIKREKCYKE